MATRIIVLAGQSNARALRDGVMAALTAQYGPGGFVLVESGASGAPITFKREEQDWYVSDELRADLRASVAAALREHPDGRVQGLIWVQGEGDSHAIARADVYAATLTLLFEDFRNTIAADFTGRDTGVTSARVAISALSEQAPEAAGRDNWQTVITQQEAVAAADARAVLVDPDMVAQAQDITGARMWFDNLHYSLEFRPHLARALVMAATGEAEQGSPPVLIGTNGNDRMTGTIGGDRLVGGLGDDSYIVDHAGDRVIEFESQGHDTIFTARSFSLRYHSQYLEDLILTGIADVNGTGNGLDNRIAGNRGDNQLDGAWGNDVLRGGAGNDTLTDSSGRNRLVGGIGDDTYVIVHSGNRIVENAWGGDDLVRASISFSLRSNGANVERLTLTGNAPIAGTGNGLDNTLIGNSAANHLNGAWGDDVIDGGDGDDWLIGHRGDDVLTGGAGRDVFVFRSGEGQDRIIDFLPGTDRIRYDGTASISASGADTLIQFAEGGSVLLEGVVTDGIGSDVAFLI